MRKCKICGKDEQHTSRIINNRKHGLLCAGCYQRELSNPITYKLPNYGEVNYSPEGKPICHICGKAYKKILAHVWQVHDLSAYEYKKEYGLETSKGIMSEESKELARKRVYENYDKSVTENLIIKGKKTRFKDGSEGRTKEYVSEQTRRKLIENIKRI